MAMVKVAKKIDKRAADAADGGIAASWPGGRNMLAITSQRLVLCKMSTMSGKYPFSVVFTDGSVAQGEGAKASGADRLGEVAATIWSGQ